MIMIIFGMGVFVGLMAGFLAMGLCQMAKEAGKGHDSLRITPLAERAE